MPSSSGTASRRCAWNDVAVHAAGVFRAVHDRDDLLRIVQASRPKPWTLDASDGYLDRLLQGIVGFRIEIERIEARRRQVDVNKWTSRRRRNGGPSSAGTDL